MELIGRDFLEPGEETLDGRYLTFQVGKETYGIEIKFVIEIVGLQPLTEMPEMPVYVKGIMNLRGRVIPVMDVRLRFGMQPKEYDDRTCIIVVDLDGRSAGLVIDNVSEVLKVGDSELMEKPEFGAGDNNGYIKSLARVAEHVILLVDCDKLIGTENCGYSD